MRIGELSEKCGVSRDALRLYHKRGLLRASRHSNGYREFPDHSVQLVQYIKLAQTLGFSIAQIAEVLPALVDAGLDVDTLRQILTQQIAEIDERIEGLTSLRSELSNRLENACPILIASKDGVVE